MIAYGPASLSEAQLLTIIIKNGKAERSAFDLAMELLIRFESIAGIEKAGIKEICEIDGINPFKAAEIKAAIEIGRRCQKPALSGVSLCSSHDVVEYYRPRMKGLQKKVYKCILLDTKNKIIRDVEVCAGSLSASIVHPRETFKAAVRESAAFVIFVRNHLTGDTKPSHEDILLTRRLVEAGQVLGIQVLDHIIIGDTVHFSFHDNKLLSAISESAKASVVNPPVTEI